MNRMRLEPNPVRLAVLVAGLSLALAGCSATNPSPSTLAAHPNASPETLVLDASSGPSLGSYLSGAGGRTLYVLILDAPDKSTCTGSCAADWPPLTAGPSTSILGPAAATLPFGKFTRPDGTAQVTYDGWPLYYYSGDSAAGETSGQGRLGTWFVAGVGGGPGTGNGPGTSVPPGGAMAPYQMRSGGGAADSVTAERIVRGAPAV
jgi:predicted lipoprotein with Yx(FWY)xxD motif